MALINTISLKLRYVFIHLIFFSSLISTASADNDVVVRCFKDAGASYGINPDLLWAIAKHESGFRQDARNTNKNGSYDVGVMQINSYWKNVIGNDLWEKVKKDYCYNIKVGAWVLAGCIQKHGYSWEAVGCYNAMSKPKRIVYANKINYILENEQKKLSRKQ